MAFRNLPFEIDPYGRAYLRDEEADAPFSVEADARRGRAANRDRNLEKLAENQGLLNLVIDPLTRTQSHLTVLAVIDFEQRRILDARLEETQPGIHGALLQGREPSDATPIASRVKGTSSGAHAIAAAMALEMACGIAPPPLAIISRNLGACGELISECVQHLFVLAGPDYSEAALSRTSLSLWAKAQKTASSNYDLHGLETIADLMRGLNPMSGHLYLESLQMVRLAREICAMIFGKYPHPATIVPAGIGIEPNKETFSLVLGRINTLLDYAKKVTAIWDDLVEFFYDAEPRYRRVGELPGNLLSVGLWDDPDQYDASYTNCNDWGAFRLATPGVIVNNELRTGRLTDINIGIEMFDEHSHFGARNADPDAIPVPADPLSEPLSPMHPWNRDANFAPDARDWKGRYSWNPAPRWDREPMETGPLARMWIGAVSAVQNCEFIGAGRRSLEIFLPKGQQPAAKLRWQIPERPNALERNRARAYNMAYAGMVAYANLLKAFDCIRRGDTAMSVRFRPPERRTGVGFWECGRGSVTHHLSIRNRLIANYQIITPAEWMGSPRDAIGLPGIYEAALINTPLLEQCARAEDFTGIDILRTIRSFDP
ncbi:MAG: nickel-dependent hydrogenase large subunit [Blastocatellia bacterium]|nr:nickel-dependent hydrogenase large subunit [Blastocatellia bacterium]